MSATQKDTLRSFFGKAFVFFKMYEFLIFFYDFYINQAGQGSALIERNNKKWQKI